MLEWRRVPAIAFAFRWGIAHTDIDADEITLCVEGLHLYSITLEIACLLI
jgi:hypothetical protein